MKTANKYSKYTGVSLVILNGKDYYWCCRIQRKKLKFKKYFPYTQEFEKIAGETYQNKINELLSTQINKDNK